MIYSERGITGISTSGSDGEISSDGDRKREATSRETTKSKAPQPRG